MLQVPGPIFISATEGEISLADSVADFLQSATGCIAGAALSPFMERLVNARKHPIADEEALGSIPPYLKKGNVIGITSPAGYITLEEIQPSIQLMESWGYTIKIG